MNRDEFNKYVKLISRRLYSLAFRILGKQDEAEDAVQEVFIRIWNMGNKLDNYESVDALATTMTKNYCIDQLRKSRIIFENDLSVRDVSVAATDEIMENAESYMIIQKIISSMAPNYRGMIIMRDIDELSYEEIAGKTGQNINTIRVNLSRARAIVRKEYSKYFNEKRRN
jgi:RNA polymerase sigma-70 factor (ECF subfamily)